MGITIHYAVPRYPMLMGNGRIPDDPYAGFIQQAEQLAQEVLNNLNFPHRINRFDRRDSQGQSGPQLVYGLEIEFEGPGKGSENLPFGWKQDQDCPKAWTGAHSCKTHFAKEASKTHRAVIEIIQAWDEARLIQSILDEANIYRRRKTQPQQQPDTQQLSMEIETMELETMKLEAGMPTTTLENPSRPEQEGPPKPSQPRRMKLILEEHKKKLKANWPLGGQEPPVVKIFNPAGASTWLIHSMDPEDEDTLFGLCDNGIGFPELDFVSLSELQEARHKVRIMINGRTLEIPILLERDLHFRPTHSLAVYANAAQAGTQGWRRWRRASMPTTSEITERTEHQDRAALRYSNRLR